MDKILHHQGWWLSHCLYSFIYTSQVVQDFFHQPYVNPSSLVGPQWTTKQLTSCEIHRRWISTFLNLRSRLLSSDMWKCFKKKTSAPTSLQQPCDICDILWLWWNSNTYQTKHWVTLICFRWYSTFSHGLLRFSLSAIKHLLQTCPKTNNANAVGFCHRWPTTEQNQNHVNHSQVYGWWEISSYTFPVG